MARSWPNWRNFYAPLGARYKAVLPVAAKHLYWGRGATPNSGFLEGLK